MDHLLNHQPMRLDSSGTPRKGYKGVQAYPQPGVCVCQRSHRHLWEVLWCGGSGSKKEILWQQVLTLQKLSLFDFSYVLKML